MYVFLNFSHTVSHNPAAKEDDGVVTRWLYVLFSFFEFWGQGWYLWVTFGDRVDTTGCFLSLALLPLGTAFMYKIPLHPCWHCSLTQVLLFCPRAQSQEQRLGGESRRALLGSSGQSFPALWASVEWAATVMLRFYCFRFIFFNITSLPAPQKARQSCWLPCNGLFSCWVEQYCCHMLKATISPRRCMSKAAAIPFPCWQM